MIKNILIGVLGLVAVSLYLIMMNTSPSEAHPIIILLFFLLLYIGSLTVLIIVLVSGSKLYTKVSRRRAFVALTYERAYMIASVLALAPVMIIAMSSVGGISFREIVLIGLFELIALFYLWKSR